MENQYGTGLYNEGVFYFTNPTKEDWSALWNNKEYLFPAKTTVPLIIANEPPENIQYIRKQFAKRLAQSEFFKSKRYKDMVKAGGYIPATYDEDTEYGPMIQACLTPLPKGQAIVKELPKESEANYKASRVVKQGQDLSKVFEDYQIPEMGQQ